MTDFLAAIRRFFALVSQTIRVLLADPLTLIINIAILTVLGLIPRLPVSAFGQQVRLVREESLALTLILLLAFIIPAVARNVSDDLRGGAAGLIFAHPVGSFGYLSARWLGIVTVAAMILVPAATAVMWGSRIVYYEFKLESLGSWVYLATLLIPLLLVVPFNYLFRIRYVFWANLALFVCFPLAFAVLGYFGYEGTEVLACWQLDWRAAIAVLYLFFGMAAFSAILTVIGVGFRHAAVLFWAMALFAAGIFVPSWLEQIPGITRSISALVLPDWQLYWIAEHIGELENEEFISSSWQTMVTVPLTFKTALFALSQSLFYLLIGAFVLRSRERA